MRDIIPKNTPKEMQARHENAVPWQLFAKKVPGNPYMKYRLRDRVGNFCEWCSQYLTTQGSVHHIDYNHTCSYGKILKIRKVKGDNNKTLKVPDCQSCEKETPEAFKACMDRLAFVHARCNLEIEIYRQSNQP